MPTTRPRHVITESDRIAEALDAAAKRWPADANNRARLLLHLVEEGFRAIDEDHERRQATWAETVRGTAVPPRSSGHVRGQGEPPPAVFWMRAALAKVGD